MPVPNGRLTAAPAPGNSIPSSDIGFERVGVRFGYAGVLRPSEVIDASAVVAREGGVVDRAVRTVKGSRAARFINIIHVSGATLWLWAVGVFIRRAGRSTYRMRRSPGGLPMEACRHGGAPLRVPEVLFVGQEAISNRVPTLSSPTVCFRLYQTSGRPADKASLMVATSLFVIDICVAETPTVAAGVVGLEVLHALHVLLIALRDALLLLCPSAGSAHARASVLVVEARVRRRAVILFLFFELLELLHLGMDHGHLPGG